MWEVRVHVGVDPLTGKVVQVSRTVRGGIKAAREMRARLLTEVAAGQHGLGTRGGVPETFGELLTEWLEHGGRPGRSPSTIAGYRRKIDGAIRPALGSVALTRLSTHQLDSWYRKLREGGTSAATVMHYHRIVSAALNQAVRWEWLDRNPAQRARPPVVAHHPLDVPPPERVRSLIQAAASSRTPDMAAVLTLAALSGLRRGELCGLRWADLDWTGSSLCVERSIWQTSDGWGVKAAKPHQVRRLVLGEHAMAALRQRRQRVDQSCQAARVALVPGAYVFSHDPRGERPLLPDNVTQAFRRLCERMERHEGGRWPYRFHDLRHYSATELFRHGHNPRTVADRLGQKDASLMLRVYTHDTEDQALAAAQSLEATLVPQDSGDGLDPT